MADAMRELPIEFTFEYCPRCATESEQLGAVPFRCGNCGFTNFFGPVAAVGAIVTNDSGELLLVRRARNPQKGCWGLPGGFVDRFETIEDAIKREVKEETNLNVTDCEYLMSYQNKYNFEGIVAAVIDLFFRCEVADGEIELVDGELDHYEWAHPTKQHLAAMAFESNRIAVQHWLEEQA